MKIEKYLTKQQLVFFVYFKWAMSRWEVRGCRPSWGRVGTQSVQEFSLVIYKQYKRHVLLKKAFYSKQKESNWLVSQRFLVVQPKPRLPRVEEQPPVVQEMINVLGTLRKRRTPSMRRRIDKAPADVTLWSYRTTPVSSTRTFTQRIVELLVFIVHTINGVNTCHLMSRVIIGRAEEVPSS